MDNAEIKSTNAELVALSSIPTDAAVSNILKGVSWRWRGGQWWRTGFKGTTAGETYLLSGFRLRSLFNTDFTNDAVLQVTPVIYKVDTNKLSAHLVEFPPIKLNLTSRGNVQRMP
jgi:hypothetical protein